MTTSSQPSETPSAADLTGCEVIVVVAGGIAAYKTCDVVSRLVQRGAGVTVAMTRSARKFVGPATFEALSGRAVLTSLWRGHDPRDVQHVSATQQADLFLAAPATANLIAKFACGIADDLVSTLFTSVDSMVLLAPSMNDRMWRHPIVQRNLKTLREIGCQTVGPDEGWLACRSVGAGRLAAPQEIVDRAEALLHAARADRGG